MRQALLPPFAHIDELPGTISLMVATSTSSARTLPSGLLFSQAADAGRPALLVFAGSGDALVTGLDLVRQDPSVRVAIHTADIQSSRAALDLEQALARVTAILAATPLGGLTISETCATLAASALPPGQELVPLGHHSLQDLGRPERLFGVNGSSALEHATLLSLGEAQHNLPPQLTSFVGRTAELHEIVQLLTSERLVTIVGPGGVGKTRAAIHAAATLVHAFDDGVWFIDLARITDGAAIWQSIAAGIPGCSGDQAETILMALRNKKLLVVLDNCEHVLADVTLTADELLRRCPSVVALCTSREPLHVEGEALVPLQPLALPPGGVSRDKLTQYEAVNLFIERARRARPDFRIESSNAASIAELCARLDGVPLAIELAAARMRMLSVEEILQGLEDRFRMLTAGARTLAARQRSLWASITWSHDLLDQDERILFRRLGVFPASFKIDAAAAICGRGLPPVFDLLSALVDRSLVATIEVRGGTRYRMLESIRDYARQLLDESGEGDELRQLHLEHYLRVIDGPSPYSRADGTWIEHWAEPEDANIDAALRWASEHDPSAFVDLYLTTNQVRWTRGRHRDRRRLAAHAAELVDVLDERRAGEVMLEASYWNRGGKAFVERAVELFRAAGAEDRLAQAMVTLADHVMAKQGLPAAIATLREANEIERRVDADSRHKTMMHLAHALVLGPDIDEALALAEESVAHAEARDGDQQARIRREAQARVIGVAGDVHRAVELAERCVREARALDERGVLPMYLWRVGSLYCAAGRHDDAWAAASEIFALVDAQIGDPVWRMFGSLLVFHVAVARGELDEARKALGDLPLGRVAFDAEFACADGALQLLAGDLGGAKERLLGAAESLGRLGFVRGQAASLLLAAEAEHRSGDAQRAEVHAWEALELVARVGVEAIDALDLLAVLKVDSAASDAARLLGATDEIRRRGGYAVPWWLREARDDALSHARRTKELTAAYEHGRTLDLAAAVSSVGRGRGKRKRAASGWDSLTPTEMQVVELVAEGLTNSQIAERMFVSPRTIHTHIAHVFTKLGVRSRAELAAAAARRPR